MAQSFFPPELPLLIYTDLDATLLDHETYSAQPARPALDELHKLRIPVIPVSSKTLAELRGIVEELGLQHPCVAENGSIIAIPHDYFDGLERYPRCGTYHILQFGPTYADIVETLTRLRHAEQFCFCGFNDMDTEEVAQRTGLGMAEAVLARQRQCSEPLIWQDNDERIDSFERALHAHGLTLTRGGRFWHVMGQADKSKAMARLNKCYADAGLANAVTIALGDSPNDLQMLNAADIAVVIRRANGGHLQLQRTSQVHYTDAPGPAGWNDFILDYLADQSASDTHGGMTGDG